MTSTYFDSNITESPTNQSDFNVTLFDVVTREEAIVLMFFYIPIFFVGLFGNVVMILIIALTPVLRNNTNWFLFNLAVADILVTLICVPMAVGQALYKVWIYGDFMCKMTAFLQGSCVAASVFTISILSMDRFLAIKRPILFRRLSGTRNAARAIFIIWIIAFAFMMPLFFVKRVEKFHILRDEYFQICVEKWPEPRDRQIYDSVLFCLIYAVPGSTICMSYGMIGRELWKEDGNLQRQESETSQCLGKQVMRSRKRVAKMLFMIAIVFAICWLPYYIVSLYIDFHYHEPLAMRFTDALPFVILLGHANSAFNPILYFYSSRTFRRYLYKMLKCKKSLSKQNITLRQMRKNRVRRRRSLGKSKPFVQFEAKNTSFNRTKYGNGSLKFSRTTNTSFRSQRSSLRVRKNRNEDALHPTHTEGLTHHVSVKIENNGQNATAENGTDDQARHVCHPRELVALDRTLDIPSTINEETSRCSSLSTLKKPSICITTPELEIINE